MERRTVPDLFLIGLLAAAILLAGFNLAPGFRGSYQRSTFQSSSPNTSQIEALKAQAGFNNPVAEAKSQLGPDATAGQNAAMLAAELLLSQEPFVVDMPLLIR
jgi:hypothetical protein